MLSIKISSNRERLTLSDVEGRLPLTGVIEPLESLQSKGQLNAGSEGNLIQGYFSEQGGCLGRGEMCDCRLPDLENSLSDRHLEIRYWNGQFYGLDLSDQGVYFASGERFPKGLPVPLHAGETYRLGHYLCHIEGVQSEPRVSESSPRFTPAQEMPRRSDRPLGGGSEGAFAQGLTLPSQGRPLGMSELGQPLGARQGFGSWVGDTQSNPALVDPWVQLVLGLIEGIQSLLDEGPDWEQNVHSGARPWDRAHLRSSRARSQSPLGPPRSKKAARSMDSPEAILADWLQNPSLLNRQMSRRWVEEALRSWKEADPYAVSALPEAIVQLMEAASPESFHPHTPWRPWRSQRKAYRDWYLMMLEECHQGQGFYALFLEAWRVSALQAQSMGSR
jgi:predicted component of type VI protein secretion system